jgi:hypothetical protein
MQVFIWVVFFAGALASRYFFGLQGRLVYAAVIFAGILLFRRYITIGLTYLASKSGLMKAMIDKMPMSIKLVRAAAMEVSAKPVAAELAKAGFIDAGAWDIPSIPKIKLTLMVHLSDYFLAAIETASSIGAQVNIHTLYSDDSVMSFTNSRLPGPKAMPPGINIVRMPGAAPSALFSKARTQRRRNGIIAVNVDDAPRIYERLYAEFIKFRKAHGA